MNLSLRQSSNAKMPCNLGWPRGILEDAGTPYLLKGQQFGLTSSIRAFPGLTGDMPFEVQVAKDRAEEARSLVAQLETE